LFPAKGNPPVEELLIGSVTVLGTAFTASTFVAVSVRRQPLFRELSVVRVIGTGGGLN
jgi:hypothetical protein